MMVGIYLFLYYFVRKSLVFAYKKFIFFLYIDNKPSAIKIFYIFSYFSLLRQPLKWLLFFVEKSRNPI